MTMRFATKTWLGLLTGVALLAGALGMVAEAAPPAERLDLQGPMRLALVPGGDIVISDTRGRRVFWLHGPNLRVESILVIKDPAREEPDRPFGVAWGADRLFVGNDTTGDVEVYAPGKKRSWTKTGRLGDADGLVPNPSDIAVDEELGLVFVVSTGKQTVMVFDIAGPLVDTIAGPGTAPENLIRPMGIALDTADQRVLVSDYDDPSTSPVKPARVQIYDYYGSYLGSISGDPDEAEEGFAFFRPQGLAVDGLGHIFLVDSIASQILVFDDTFVGVATVGGKGSGPGQLSLPMDLVLDPKTRDLLVTDNLNRRVEVFENGGLVP
jgi:tripartite motif-containing protein 2/3/tripartite motif-containing protein 71